MNVLSLFSGIGGFDLGFQQAGMTVIGICEIDKHAQKVLVRQFPDAQLHTDVKEIGAHTYAKGSVDVICGGFPCQDISVAGKRRGLAGNRSGLWYEFARIIDEVEPAWVVIENVPGLFSSADGEDFATIIQWLASRGYGVGWRVLDAQGFGLAQRRKRVFIVGSFGTPRGCTVLLESESLQRDSQSRKKTEQNSTRSIAASVGGNRERATAYAIDNPIMIQGNHVDRNSAANGSGFNEHNVSYTLTSTDRHAVAWKMRVTGGNPSGVRGGKNTHPGEQGYLDSEKAFTVSTTQDQYLAVREHPQVVGVQDVSPTLRAAAKQSLMSGSGDINSPLAIDVRQQQAYVMREDAGNNTFSIQPTDVSLTLQAMQPAPTTHHAQLFVHDASVLWESTHTDNPARIASDQTVAPTLQARMGTGGNSTPMIGVRRITPTECERLMGFPDGWTAGQSDAQRYKQLGNAVAVPVARWIGERIMKGTSPMQTVAHKPTTQLYVEELRQIPYAIEHMQLLRRQTWIIAYYDGKRYHVSTNGINVMVISKERGQQHKPMLLNPLVDDDTQLQETILTMIQQIAAQ